jgi:aminocarboxymuconate-semialdehyde decarboxylase
MMFGGVFERFPKLRVAFAHGGGSFPFTVGRVERAFHVRPDLTAVDNKRNPREYLASKDGPARFYVDSLVHNPDALQMLLKIFGAERVALGSDYPFPLGEGIPGQLIESMSVLSQKDKERVLAGTAGEFLGLG